MIIFSPLFAALRFAFAGFLIFADAFRRRHATLY